MGGERWPGAGVWNQGRRQGECTRTTRTHLPPLTPFPFAVRERPEARKTSKQSAVEPPFHFNLEIEGEEREIAFVFSLVAKAGYFP